MAKAKTPVAEEELPATSAQDELSALETPVEETPVAEVAAPEVPAAPSFLDRVKELGFQDVADENAARDRLLADYQQRVSETERIKAELDQQKVYAKYGQEYLEGLRSNPQPSAQSTPSSAERKDWWTPPKYDNAVAERYREAKADGAYGWKENTPAEIRVAAESYQAYIENWAHQLATNPKEALRGIKDEIREEILSEFDTKYQGYRQQETIEEFQDRLRSENEWLFEKDPRTNRVDYSRMSADGQRMDALVTKFMSPKYNNLPLPEAWELAKEIYDLQQVGTQTAAVVQQQTNQQVAATQKQKVLQRARGLGPQRNGSATPANNPNGSVQNPMRTAGDYLREQMRADGTSPALS